jgi:hypothetical protein
MSTEPDDSEKRRDSAGGANSTPLPFGIAGLHFFFLGGFNKTVDWINAERGR